VAAGTLTRILLEWQMRLTVTEIFRRAPGGSVVVVRDRGLRGSMWIQVGDGPAPGTWPLRPELAGQILAFEKHYNAAARPFDWKFTRTDRNQFLARIRRHDRHAPNPMAA
jgi:hypothetical protein